MRKILLATAAGFAALLADGATPARAQSAAEVTGQTPQPGLTLSTTGRFRFLSALIGQDGRSSTAGDKLTNYDFNTYGRLRFDLDGVSETGLRYGGRLEARMIATGGADATLFFRVANGYIGTPMLGQLRFGSGGVQAVPQMTTGHIMGSIAAGLWDGDGTGFFFRPGQQDVLPSNFWFSSSSVNRAAAIGYYSPQFFGFDIGLSFAPNEKGFLGDCSGASTPITSCDRISTVASGNANQLRNIIDAMIRYRGTFGPVGVALSGGLRTATTTSAVGTATSFKNPTVGIIGGQVTFAGFTVGGLTYFGNANRGFTALPSTGNNDGMFAWQIGARYDIGALSVGAAYHELKSEGTAFAPPAPSPADRRDRGFGLGASYALAPGLSLFGEYLWGRVRENGVEFGVVTIPQANKFQTQLFMVGLGIGF